MKVIKSQDVPQNAPSNGQPDQEQIAQLQEKFDALRSEIETKFYSVCMNKEQTTFFFDEVYPSIEWKGYESYAVSESYDRLSEGVKDGEMNAKVRPEIIEAAFHFIKNFVSKGIDRARMFKQIADQLALSINDINQDRQNLRDVSLELVAAEKGIPVETLVSELQKEQQMQQNMQG
jgi:hypothetical protein